MGFSDNQVRALNRRVPARRIRTRISDGKELSYIEGWYALDQANQIFGFDRWSRETLEVRCISAKAERGAVVATYAARVRVCVWTGDREVIRDGSGTGEATAASAGEAHDRALKTAETDATKRALATFGKAFGLALYAGSGPRAHSATERKAAGLEGTKLPAASQPTETDTATASTAPKATAAALPFPKLQRVRDRGHLRYVASQPCLLCSAAPSDAHHLRFAQPRAMGRKVGDEFTVPLCRAHHRELHNSGNEVAWWHDMGIDPLPVAEDLWAEHKRAAGSSPRTSAQRN